MNRLSSVVVVVVVGGGGGACFLSSVLSVHLSSGIPPWLLLALHLFCLSETQTFRINILENFDHLCMAT